MTQVKSIACLILAAGASQRFGSNKMRHPFDGSRTILQATIQQCLTVFDSVDVVLPAVEGDMAESVESTRVRLIENQNSHLGMSQSIVEGVARTQPNTGWLVVLGDMPYVRSDTLEKIIEPLTPQTIIVPTRLEKPGNPVAFGCDFKPVLLGLTGDVGAKSVVLSDRESVRFVDVDDEGIHRDIDVPSELTR